MIDKAAFFGKSTSTAATASAPAPGSSSSRSPLGQNASNWAPHSLRPVPAFYPLEKSSRFLDDDLVSVTSRLSECLRLLSVHAAYNNETATASLHTGENVEMHLSLWEAKGGIVAELQRRKGDSITFHRYCKHILDAAMGESDLVGQANTHGQAKDIANMYSKKTERMLKMRATGKPSATEEESAVIAVEIAHGLLMKDRMDARQLGLESLCLLTDPNKTGAVTALIASKVVLLGTADLPNNDAAALVFDESPFQEIRETILSLIQLRRIGDEQADDDHQHQGSASQHDSDEDDALEGQYNQEKEHLAVLHNLALAVLANALDVMENQERLDQDPEETSKKPAAAVHPSQVASSFMADAKNITSKELLSTLISELGRAAAKPHNACLSAKCLGCLLKASDDARRRAKELGAKNVVSTALDVGVRTHAKLEQETRLVLKVLQQTEQDDVGVEEQEGRDRGDRE